MSHPKRSPFRCRASPRGGADGPIIPTLDQVSRPKQGRHFWRNAAPNGQQLACTFINFRAPCTTPPQIFGLWPPPVLYIQGGFRRQCFRPIETEQLNGRKSIPALSIIYTNTPAPIISSFNPPPPPRALVEMEMIVSHQSFIAEYTLGMFIK
jgi:hypothetical protein